MEPVIALVLDTSLTATGWALVRLPLDDDGGGRGQVPVVTWAGRTWCGVIPVPGPPRPLAERIAVLCDALTTLIAQAREAGLAPRFAVAETPAHTYVNPADPARSSGKGQWALIAQQRTFGAVAQWFVHGLGVPFAEVAPAAAKLAASGSPTASKDEVGRALALRFPELATLGPARGRKAWREAIGDALAVAVWADGALAQRRIGVPSGLDVVLADDTPPAPVGRVAAVLAALTDWRDADAAFGWAAVSLESGGDVRYAQVAALEELATERRRALDDALAALAGDWSVATSQALRRVGL
ncbi:MAG TPA: hypothetical protein VFL91_33990 [Thermomicrobiales bacterium]|nr:hypothetical protein [Thermomicrobiales bacterium]